MKVNNKFVSFLSRDATQSARLRPKSITPVSPYSKSTTSPQHKRQVRNKLAQTKVRSACYVASFSKFHYSDLLPTCCGLVGRVANKSVAIELRNKLATSPFRPTEKKLRGNVCNGFWLLYAVCPSVCPFVCADEV